MKTQQTNMFRIISICLTILFLGLMSASNTHAQTYAYIPANSNVYVIDTANDTVVKTVNILNNPYGIAVAPDGKKVYMTGGSSGNVVDVFDTAINNVTKTIPVGNNPTGVAVLPDSKKVYVTNFGTDNNPGNTVSVIDASSETVVKTVTVETSPMGIVASPDGKKVYVVNEISDDISVIDTTNDIVVDSIPIGIAHFGIAINPAGTKLYATTYYASSNLTVVDIATKKVINVQTAPAYEIAITPDGRKVYMSIAGLSNSVGIYDTSTNNFTRVSVTMYPSGIAVTPDNKKVYIANYGYPAVDIFNVSTNQFIDPVYIGSGSNAFGQFIGSVPIQPVPLTYPVANFTSNFTFGFSPFSVQFTDLSQNATGWYWDFGDGANSTQQNTTHVYTAVGNFTVNLTVSNDNGTASKSATIRVIQYPFPFPPSPGGFVYDLNGNGRLDFADVVLYFNNIQWIQNNWPIQYFDYNKNGRIDFSDVVILFNMKSS